MKPFLLLVFFFLPLTVYADTNHFYVNVTDAIAACQAKATSIGYPTETCEGGSYTGGNLPYCGATGNGQSFFRRTGPPSNYDKYFYCSTGSTNCPSYKTINESSGACSCPSGYWDSGTACEVKPPDCTLQEYNAMADGCPLESSQGWPEHTCFDYAQNTIAFVQACSPTCGPDQHVEGNSCVDNPVCVGDQIYNNQTNQCDEPICPGQATVDPNTHVCVDPICNTQTETLCNSVCWPSAECSIGYQSVCPTDPTMQPQCNFNGCPTGYDQGTLNGQIICTKSGETTTGTGTQTGTETTNSTSQETSTTTQNPDGTTTTTTTTTTNGTTTVQNDISVTLDTAGLAQESTQVGILDTLSQLLGSEFSHDANATNSSIDSAINGMLAHDKMADADADSIVQDSSSPFDGLTDYTSWLPGFSDMPSSPSCSGSIPITWNGKTVVFEPCEKLAPLREVIAWVFYILTSVYVFNIWMSVKD